MSHAYTEDQLVEQPAIGLFAALGWQTVSAMEETFGPGGTLGRETKGEVVLVDRLRAALVKFNPDAAARGDQHRHRRADPRPLGHEPGGGQPRGLPAAQGRHPGLRARPRARRPEDRAPARHRLGAARAERLPAGQPVQRRRQPLHLPARSGRLRQRPAVGGGRTEEARRAGARGLRREPHPLQARRFRSSSGSTRCSSPATAPTAASARSPPTGSASSSGSASSARTSRAACRWR